MLAELSAMAPTVSTQPSTLARTGEVTVVTYNILAKSLGSNCIPWVIEISSSLKDRVEASTNKKWNDWRLDVLQTAYKAHFHKNDASGDYMAMRAFSPGVWPDIGPPSSSAMYWQIACDS